MNIDTDTIAAIATPIGKGGVGIIRISGKDAYDILTCIFTPKGKQKNFLPRYLTFGSILDLNNNHSIENLDELIYLDQGFAVYMPSPNSYTGEDVVELQCHGSPILLKEILALVLSQGARLATPGEFTLRAFLNGRLDLAQAEAVCDIIESKTTRAANIAERQLAGVLSHELTVIDKGLRHIISQIIASIDFPEDVDIPETSELLSLIQIECERIKILLKGAELGLTYREGIRTALIGVVNAGKSSLMNALLKRDRAIVTSQPGTTRDLIEECLDIYGIPVCLYDTAGIRFGDKTDEAENMGIERSYAICRQARLILLVIDASKDLDQESQNLIKYTADQKRIIILNKKDIASSKLIISHRKEIGNADPICIISAKTGQGLDELKKEIQKICANTLDSEVDSPLINNIRHIHALKKADKYLSEAELTLKKDLPVDLAVIDIENACLTLSEITGTIVTDEVLKEIFSRFCLGK